MNRIVEALSSLRSYVPGHTDPGTDRQRRALLVLQRQERSLASKIRKREQLLRDFDVAAKRGSLQRLARLSARIPQLAREIRQLERLSPTKERELVFSFSSATLRDSFRVCTETPEEGMHFIVGIDVEGMYVGTHNVGFPYVHRSVAGAAGVHQETHRVFVQAVESGHYIVAMLHSHPGSGVHANHPSQIDMNTHELWERGGFRMVGGIWTRDGHLRWYAHRMSFRVNIVGTHLSQVDDHVWKLEI